jgi:hypothetical protein
MKTTKNEIVTLHEIVSDEDKIVITNDRYAGVDGDIGIYNVELAVRETGYVKELILEGPVSGYIDGGVVGTLILKKDAHCTFWQGHVGKVILENGCHFSDDHCGVGFIDAEIVNNGGIVHRFSERVNV